MAQDRRSIFGLAVIVVLVIVVAGVMFYRTGIPVATDKLSVKDQLVPESGLQVIKLPDGNVIRSDAASPESKLVAFITDPSKEADKTTWFTLQGLEFSRDSAKINASSDPLLDHLALIMKAFPKVRMKFGGYTDSVGDADANLQLSKDRAAATLSALVARGIESTRLESEGYGGQFPVADNGTVEGRARNRRVSVHITEK